MAMTVTLYKNAKVNGSTRGGYWTSLSSQTSYFDSLTKKTYNVPTVALGQPLRINDNLNNLLQYGYGHIDYGNGFRYYFVIGDLEFVTETLTNIHYQIDCYETSIKQTNIQLARATLDRVPTKKGKVAIPYEPNYLIEDSKTVIPSTECSLYYVRVDSKDNNKWYVGMIKSTDMLSGIDNIANTYWIREYGISETESDIVCAGILPCVIATSQAGWQAKGTDVRRYYECESVTYANIDSNSTINKFGTLKNDGITYDCIKDMRGNIIYQCPYQETKEVWYAGVAFSTSSINLMMEIRNVSDRTKNEIVTIPAEGVSVMVDSFAEYNARQRQFDIDLRELQSRQQLESGIVNSGTSALNGAVGGAVAGGGVGAGVGAVAGFITGIISAVGNYAIEEKYNPRMQALIDKSYQYANGTLTLSGYATALTIIFTNLCGKFTYTFDNDTKNAYNNDVANNGYYTAYSTTNLSNELTTGSYQGTVEVLGDVPYSWKTQIQDRFASGVKLV